MSIIFENKGAMAATIVVAASDSLNKGAANLVCSGAAGSSGNSMIVKCKDGHEVLVEV